MRLLADENIPIQAIEMLRKKGHDVLAISESAPSICDENVMGSSLFPMGERNDS